MAGAAFIDFPIVRRGGVLFIAAEGGTEIPLRLQAVLENKYPQIERAAFAWTNTSPQLLGRKAISQLARLAQEAAARMQGEFGLPLALIVIDTIVAAAGYSKIGEESDAAVGQAIMNVLEQLAQRSGALVLGIDHFGKSAETGTRGTSAKEGAADVVLALLGAKSINGEITNTRLATRKRRSGPSGEEFPYSRGLGLSWHRSIWQSYHVARDQLGWWGTDNPSPFEPLVEVAAAPAASADECPGRPRPRAAALR